MADKNIEMKVLNGSGTYDALYPKTSGSQTTLSDNTSVENFYSDYLGLVDDYTEKGQDFFSIGDVKLSRKNDLGEKWLKCDGSSIWDVKYSELLNMLGADNMRFDGIDVFNSTFMALSNLIEFNNYIVCVGTDFPSSGGGYRDTKVYYTSKENFPNGVWLSSVIPNTPFQGGNNSNIVNVNNELYFCRPVQREGIEGRQLVLYKTANLIDYTEIVIPFSNNAINISEFYYSYQNGHHICSANIRDSNTNQFTLKIASLENIPNAEWNIIDLYNIDTSKFFQERFSKVIFYKNKYVFTTGLNYKSGPRFQLKAFISEDLTTTNWREVLIAENGRVSNIDVIDDILVIMRGVISSSPSNSITAVFWTTTNLTTYSSTVLLNGRQEYYQETVQDIIKYQGRFFVKIREYRNNQSYHYRSYLVFAYSSNLLSGYVTTQTTSKMEENSQAVGDLLICNNKIYTYAFSERESNPNDNIVRCNFIPRYGNLPNISPTGNCNYFIKAVQ